MQGQHNNSLPFTAVASHADVRSLGPYKLLRGRLET